MKNIVMAREDNLNDWVRMGLQLWPDNTEDELEKSFLDTLKSDNEEGLLYCLDNDYVGFINVSIRSDYVNGSTSSPVAYVEGIYVKPQYRNRNIARELIRAGEIWGSNKGCIQMGSDILIDNKNSYDFHKKVGFDEAETVICFIKDISK
ncbi:MAG: aminoglycoside 6'-N-acetyltransferase [Tissierellales bacterium]